MTPLAVDYPPPDTDCNAYPQGGTSFGDDLISRCDVPPGWYPEVVTQPVYGVVAFDAGGLAWSYTPRPDVTLPTVNTPDPFTFRLTDGTGHSDPATCTVLLCVEV